MAAEWLKIQSVSHTSVPPCRKAADRWSLSPCSVLQVRAIWGKQSEAVVDALKQQKQLATRLIQQWEMAEHRLIAVANSLSVSSSGQVSA